MKSIDIATAACAFVLTTCWSLTQAAHASPASPLRSSTSAAPRLLPLSSGSICAKTERIVFSCPLDNGTNTVSLCAAGDMNQEPGRIYYTYGGPASPELIFPSGGQHADDAFTRTHLGFGGNTGGYAYSFVNDDYKYVIYEISGEGNLGDSGVIVQRVGQRTVTAKMHCQPGKVIETQDDQVIDATLKWKSDPEIEAHGLPRGH